MVTEQKENMKYALEIFFFYTYICDSYTESNERASDEKLTLMMSP